MGTAPLSAPPTETEVKFGLGDRAAFERALRALGAAPGPLEEERNVLFDDAASALRLTGCALRVRTASGRGVVTFKGEARHDRGVKSRLELETSVDDPATLEAILAAVGFFPRFTYEKRRTTWRFADPGRPLVVVDETPLGLFAEIEGEAAAVRTLAAELAIDEAGFLSDSYAALWEKARAGDPTLPPDMTWAGAPAAVRKP